MNLSGSTAGPPHPLEGLISQNGVSYVGAAGRVENNTIFGSGNAQPGVGGNGAGTAVLLSGAHDVTVTNNTLTSPAAPRPGTDVGISVSAGSTTGIVISFNRVNRLGPDVPDTAGIGIDVFTPNAPAFGGPNQATLICNTFSGWNTNVIGAEQIACTPLPNGSECQAYSAPAPAVDSGKNYAPTSPFPVIDATPFTWTVDSGTLPPGLSLSSGGAITGTPTAAGTYNFTLKLVDSTGLTATQAQTITISSRLCPTSAAPAAPAASAAPDDRSPDPEDGQPESGERRRDAHVHACRPQQRAEHGDAGRDHRLAPGDGDLPLVELDAGDVLPLGAARDLRDRHHAGRRDRHGHDQGAPAAAGQDPERDGDRGRPGGDEHGQQP